MGQSKLESFVEAMVNTAVGLTITMSFLPFVNWLLDIQMNLTQMTWSTTLFTAISVARGYVIRRWFNNLSSTKRMVHRFVSKLLDIKWL